MKTILDVNLYTRKEVEEMLGVATATLRAYVQRGEIVPRWLGHEVYFTEEAIRDFLYCKNVSEVAKKENE